MNAEVDKIVAKNKRATFDYAILDSFTAGIVLTGTEMKSIREGKVNLADAYCSVKDEEVWALNIQIEEYKNGGHYNHAPRRQRKLLLKRTEIRKIVNKLKDKGLTLICLNMFLSPKGLVKLEIAVGKGKKSFDKREDIKQKDIERENQRRF